MRVKYPDQLEADFQQYYGLDIAKVDKERASRLACQLPRQSRVLIAMDQANLWSNSDIELIQIANGIETIKWQLSNQGSRRRRTSPPKPYIPEELRTLAKRAQREKTTKSQDLEPHTIDEMKQILARPRK